MLRVPEMTHMGPGPVTSAKFAGVLFSLILWVARGKVGEGRAGAIIYSHFTDEETEALRGNGLAKFTQVGRICARM